MKTKFNEAASKFVKALAIAAVLLPMACFAQSVNIKNLEKRNDVYYLKGKKVPYSGEVILGDCQDCGAGGSVTIKNGKFHGIYSAGDEYGGETGSYKEGKKDGEWKEFDNEENSTKVTNYKDGEKHGEYKLLYGEKIRESGTYKDGKKDGEWKVFDENGNLKTVVNYNEGNVAKANNGSLKSPRTNDIDIETGASRSKQEVMQVVNSRMPGPKNIYNKYLNLKPGFKGNLTLKLTIAPSGEVSSIDIASSTTDYADFDNAIKNIVATWKWTAINSGNTTLTIPFSFE